jgi:hypothetical protein
MAGGTRPAPHHAGLAADYRARARELRVFAGEFTDSAAQRDLLAIADKWEAMAEQIDAQPTLPSLFPQIR